MLIDTLWRKQSNNASARIRTHPHPSALFPPFSILFPIFFSFYIQEYIFIVFSVFFLSLSLSPFYFIFFLVVVILFGVTPFFPKNKSRFVQLSVRREIRPSGASLDVAGWWAPRPLARPRACQFVKTVKRSRVALWLTRRRRQPIFHLRTFIFPPPLFFIFNKSAQFYWIELDVKWSALAKGIQRNIRFDSLFMGLD